MRSEGHSGVETPQTDFARFVLRYPGLDIGILELRNGSWSFFYTDDFKEQSDQGHGVKPLIGFSSIHTVYTSEELWPFFALRIPSLQQPAVQKVIREEKLDKRNAAELLKRFGSKTITSPFSLEPLL